MIRFTRYTRYTVLLFILFLFACVSTPEVEVEQTETEAAAEEEKPAEKEKEATSVSVEKPVPADEPKESGDSAAVATMSETLESALDSLDQGLVSEGLKRLVSVLAEKSQLSAPSEEAVELARKAEAKLEELASSIAIEADTDWMDENMNQKVASTIDLMPMPSVILTIRSNIGRSLISNAPVTFEFVKGSGAITGVVNTNDFGQANCSIAAFDNPQEENIIRASLVYRVRGFSYSMKDVQRDFAYSPPERNATILVMERSEQGISEDPYVLDPVFAQLKELDFNLSLYNALLSPDDFLRVYEGDKESIARMSLIEGTSYLVVILNDCYSVRQLEMDGKKYNIYVADARATTRIIRVEDGKIMYQNAVERSKSEGTHGQGGTQEKAILDVIRKISEDMANSLGEEFSEITKALTGKTD